MAFKLPKVASGTCFYIFMLGFSYPVSVFSGDWSFTKIAGTNMTIPGTSVTYLEFRSPSISFF